LCSPPGGSALCLVHPIPPQPDGAPVRQGRGARRRWWRCL